MSSTPSHSLGWASSNLWLYPFAERYLEVDLETGSVQGPWDGPSSLSGFASRIVGGWAFVYRCGSTVVLQAGGRSVPMSPDKAHFAYRKRWCGLQRELAVSIGDEPTLVIRKWQSIAALLWTLDPLFDYTAKIEDDFLLWILLQTENEDWIDGLLQRWTDTVA